MQDLTFMAILFVIFSLGLGINAAVMAKKIRGRNTDIVLLEKPKKFYYLGMVSTVFTLMLYFVYKVPDNVETFLGMLAIVISYTIFSYLYKNLVAFYSKEGIFFNDKEIPYKKIDFFQITDEESKAPKVMIRYKSEGKKKNSAEIVEQGVLRVKKEILTALIEKLRKERVRRKYS